MNIGIGGADDALLDRSVVDGHDSGSVWRYY